MSSIRQLFKLDVFSEQVHGREERFSAKALIMRYFPKCAQLIAYAVECECNQVQTQQRV